MLICYDGLKGFAGTPGFKYSMTDIAASIGIHQRINVVKGYKSLVGPRCGVRLSKLQTC